VSRPEWRGASRERTTQRGAGEFKSSLELTLRAPNYQQQKKQREQAKRKRNDAKRVRKGQTPPQPEQLPPV